MSAWPAPLRFLAAYAVALFLMAVALCAAVTITDPSRYFFGSFMPQIWPNTRRVKIDLFRDYSANGKVTGLILGSSRSTLLLPEQADRATGLRFFNAALLNVSTDDFLAQYRLFRKMQAAPPRIVVIGLELFTLGAKAPVSEDLIASYPLMSQLEPGLTIPAHYAKLYGYYFRLQTLTDFGTSIGNWRAPKPPANVFLADGHLYGPAIPEHPLQFALGAGMEPLIAEYRDFDQLSDMRIGRLRTLLREASGDGARVLIWLTPLHPELQTALGRLPGYPHAEREARAVLATLCNAERARRLDLTDAASFGGDPSTWLDTVHTSGVDAARELDTILHALQN